MVPISTGLSWVRMEPLLRNAQTDYILPLLGEEQTSELDAIYEMRPADRSKTEENALAVAQKAVVNLALWSNFDALSVRISDQGFQRQESDSWRPAYKYQEDMLRRTFANAGFNAHNQYMESLLAAGVAGLLALLLFLLMPLAIALRTRSQRCFVVALFSAIVMFNLLFESMLERQMGLLFVGWLFSVMVLILSVEENKFARSSKS